MASKYNVPGGRSRKARVAVVQQPCSRELAEAEADRLGLTYEVVREYKGSTLLRTTVKNRKTGKVVFTEEAPETQE